MSDEKKKAEGLESRECLDPSGVHFKGPFASGEDPVVDTEEIGIPESLRIKRKYTLSEKALAQRQAAANSPEKAKAMQGNKNAWKHGQYAQGFIDNFIKPCLSTCPQYPCSIVEKNETRPGDICLDKSQILTTFRALQRAVKDKEYDDINEIAALKVAGAIQIVDMLIEDIIRDGPGIKEAVYSKSGDIAGYKIKQHPLLESLPKMLSNLGLTLHDLHVTPKAVEKKDTEEEGIKTLADLMSQIGQNIQKQQDKEPDDDGND